MKAGAADYLIKSRLSPDNGDTSKVLIRRADEALYLAKNSDRDCFKFYN